MYFHLARAAYCIELLRFSDFGGYVLEILANYSDVDYKTYIIFGKVSIRYVSLSAFF